MSEPGAKPARVRTADVVAAGLARRHRAERRFRAYGLLSLTAALLFLALLLGSIVRQGHGAFRQTYIQLEVNFDPALLDPAGTRNPEALAQADYSTLIRRALAARFPDVTDPQRKARAERAGEQRSGLLAA